MNESTHGPGDGRAIGVFDSGVGGLTVLHECLVNLPHEDYIYLGDTANSRHVLMELVKKFSRSNEAKIAEKKLEELK